MNQKDSLRPSRPVSLFWSIVPFVLMLFILGFGYGKYNLKAEVLLIFCGVITGTIAYFHGISWKEMEEGIVEKLSKSMPATLILTCVGALIGAWIFSGTIPMMIYYGVQMIHPSFVVVISFLITSVVSSVTGTSWGSVGTMGVALIGIAAALDVSLPLTAGAIVAGSYFGDKMSPLSDTTNLSPLIAGSNIYEHIKHMLYTTLPIFIVSIGIYLVLGYSSGSVSQTPEKIAIIKETLETMYTFGPMSLLLILPVLIVVAGSILKLPTIPVMLASSALAILIGITIQNFSFVDGVTSLVNGFQVKFAAAKFASFNEGAIIWDITRLCNRGGMMSMMSTLLLAYSAFGFAGIVSKAGMLDTIIDSLSKKVELNSGNVILSTVLSCILVAVTTGSSYLSIIVPGEMFQKAYKKAGLHPVNLSRTLEDAGTVIVPLIPWSMAGAYMASTLGVPVVQYAPYAFLCYGCFILAIVYGYTGFGIKRIPLEEENSPLEKRESSPKLQEN